MRRAKSVHDAYIGTNALDSYSLLIQAHWNSSSDQPDFLTNDNTDCEKYVLLNYSSHSSPGVYQVFFADCTSL